MVEENKFCKCLDDGCNCKKPRVAGYKNKIMLDATIKDAADEEPKDDLHKDCAS